MFEWTDPANGCPSLGLWLHSILVQFLNNIFVKDMSGSLSEIVSHMNPREVTVTLNEQRGIQKDTTLPPGVMPETQQGPQRFGTPKILWYLV